MNNLQIEPYILMYDKFCQNPVMELNKIYERYERPPINKLVIDTSKMHLIAGNPIRYNGKIEIRADEEWKTKLNPKVTIKINYIIKANLKSELIRNLYGIQ